MQYGNGRILENVILNGASYCSLTGAALCHSPGSNLIENTEGLFNVYSSLLSEKCSKSFDCMGAHK